MATGLGRRKQAYPTPKRNHSLWRGCLFASACGFEKGFTSGGLNTPDDQTRERASMVGTMLPASHTLIDAGRALATGDFLDEYRWGAPLGRYDLTLGFSVATVVRPIFTHIDWEQGVFCKVQDVGLTGSGWWISASTLNAWEVGFANGVATGAIQSTSTPNVERTDIIVGRYDLSFLDIWVNGKREGRSAAPSTPGVSNNALDVMLFNSNGGANPFIGQVTMAALWNRRISEQEVERLFADPYVMWRQSRNSQFLGMAFGGGGVGDNDCCCPCCGGSIHFGL